ncbi:MAG TPA: hypothetical protein VFN61_09200 [Acidimicrobiales bacterium]|nr:hypothetical protein [Acidimicrobiales bacterium]
MNRNWAPRNVGGHERLVVSCWTDDVSDRATHPGDRTSPTFGPGAKK